MGWFRKIVNVLIVVGVAALMSIPFKRVPPQTTSKSGLRGEWELDRPNLPFKLGDILSGDERPTTSNKPVIPSTDAGDARNPESDSATRNPATRDSNSGTDSESNSGSPARSFGDEAASGSSSSTSSGDRDGSRSSNESLPVLRDDDRRRPMSTLPRIEGQPARQEKLEDQAPLPSLPTEFQPLRDS